MAATKLVLLLVPALAIGCASTPRAVGDARAPDCSAESGASREDAQSYYGRTGQFPAGSAVSAGQGAAAPRASIARFNDETPSSYFGRTGQYPAGERSASAADGTASEDARSFYGRTGQYPSTWSTAVRDLGEANCQARE